MSEQELREKVADTIKSKILYEASEYAGQYLDYDCLPEMADAIIPLIRADERARTLQNLRVPTKGMLLALVLHDWPNDWERGKKFQREHGFDICGPNCESEVAMGRYQKLLDIWESLPRTGAEDGKRDAALGQAAEKREGEPHG